MQDTQLIGDNLCNSEYNLPECGFDGGDCCPVMDDPRLGDGFCDGYVFNTEICGFDEGDCDSFNKEYPMCCGLENHTLNELWNEFQRLPHFFAIGDGICDNVPMYNTPECGFDGGDCKKCFDKFENHMKLEEFQSRYFDKFGDGACDPKSPMNIDICGYEGRDCYDCMMHDDPSFNVSKLGDGVCDGGDYQTESCYYDGGDCLNFIEDYPNCDAEFPSLIGDGKCHSEYDNEECGGDGGDCQNFKELHDLENCDVEDIDRIGDGICDGGDYLSEECAFDGGDCGNCTLGDKTMSIDYIGDGLCDGENYMTEACGFDGGDCDNCRGKDIQRVGDGNCDQDLNNYDCGYDGGDCLADYSNATVKSSDGNIFSMTGSVNPVYSEELAEKLLKKVGGF